MIRSSGARLRASAISSSSTISSRDGTGSADSSGSVSRYSTAFARMSAVSSSENTIASVVGPNARSGVIAAISASRVAWYSAIRNALVSAHSTARSMKLRPGMGTSNSRIRGRARGPCQSTAAPDSARWSMTDCRRCCLRIFIVGVFGISETITMSSGNFAGEIPASRQYARISSTSRSAVPRAVAGQRRCAHPTGRREGR